VITDCEGTDVVDRHLGTTALDNPADDPDVLVFRPFGSVEFADHHCTDGSKGQFGLFDDGGDPHALWESPSGLGPFDQAFELPAEAIGSGRIVQWVKPQSGQIIPAACPGYSQAPGERCSARLDWAGSITFTKLPDDPTEPVPLVTPTAPATLRRPRHAPGTAREAARRHGRRPDRPARPAQGQGRRARPHAVLHRGLHRRLRRHGDDRRRPVGPGARAAAKAKALAILRFRVPAGRPRTIRLKLPAAVRRHLRRHRRATVAVTLRPKTGAARRTTLPLTIPRG
jgi:hypothetical protein